jgi:hypothetical protein
MVSLEIGGVELLIIWCENKDRACVKNVCCHECDTKDCCYRCNKKLIDECEDFSEDID